MPIKISKKTRKTKGKGKVSQSQQVIVNIQKGKRKASSQPVIRPSPAPIIIQQPQQDYTQLENLFKQYSTSRSVMEPVKVPEKVSFETQIEKPIMTNKQTYIDMQIPINLEEQIKLEQKKLKEKLMQLEEEKPIKLETPKSVRPTTPKTDPIQNLPLRERIVEKYPNAFNTETKKWLLNNSTPVRQISPSIRQIAEEQNASKREIKEGYILNPVSNRQIKIGGAIYKNLVKENKI